MRVELAQSLDQIAYGAYRLDFGHGNASPCTSRAPRGGDLRSPTGGNGQVTVSVVQRNGSRFGCSEPTGLALDWWSGTGSNCRPSAFQRGRTLWVRSQPFRL